MQEYFRSPVQPGKIESENEKFVRTPKHQNQTSFPYCNLPSDRDFERLLYYIFDNENTKKEFDNFYDEVLLMQGTGERGRDVWLKRRGQSVGLVQCKKHRDSLSKNKLIEEVLKFALHSVKDPDLIGIDTSSEKFKYYIAVSSGIKEPAQNFISNFNHGSNNLIEEDIKSSYSKLTVVYSSLKSLGTYASQRGAVFQQLKKIQIIPIYPSCLDLWLSKDNYKDILKLFFEVQPVIDENRFKEILERREQERIDLVSTLTPMENQLYHSKSHPRLFGKLQQIKKKAEELHNTYPGNCLEYSDHRKEHQKKLIQVVSKLVIGEILNKLNIHEIFILAASCYLTDIGICQESSSLYGELDLNHSLPSEMLRKRVQENHHKLTRQFLPSWLDSLEIFDKSDKEYIKAITLVSSVSLLSMSEISDRSKYELNFYVGNQERLRVNLPLLACTILLGDLLDIQSTNSEILFKEYINFPDFQTAKLLWEEIDWEEIDDSIQAVPSECGTRVEFLGKLDRERGLDDQVLFLGLSERIELIQRAISGCDRILQDCPLEKRIEVKFVDNHIESPFRKNFGFSMDTRNILGKLFGARMYENEYMAIREVIQNAIDACLLRAYNEKDYEPKIIVRLEEDHLVVEDNGIGMNENILEEYFAKVGRSYYVENHVPNSIGQFGIGVCAYFMLCDQFTVETRSHQSETFRFTASKNSPYKFYFYNSSERDIGTTIWIPFSPEISIGMDQLLEYIDKTFKYSPTPIYILTGKEEVGVVSGEKPRREEFQFNNSKEKVLERCIRLPYRGEFVEYEYKSIYYEMEYASGVVGFFIPKELRKPESFNIRRKSESNLGIFQVGVYVKDQSRFFGEININKPLPLKLDRNDFQDQCAIRSIVDEFEIRLLQEVVPKLDKLARVNFTNLYLLNYYGNGEISNRKLEDASELLYFPVLISGSEENIFYTLRQIQQEFHTVGIFFVEGSNDEIYFLKQSVSLRIPIIPVSYLVGSAKYLSRYLAYSGFGFSIRNLDDFSIMVASRCYEHVKPFLRIKQALVLPFEDSDVLCTSVPNPGEGEYINLNHPIVRCIKNNTKAYETDRKLRKNVDTFFNELVDIIRNAYQPFTPRKIQTSRIEIWRLNSHLAPINEWFGTSFHLLATDFPVWMRNRIDTER